MGKKLRLHPSMNSLSLIKLSCFSHFADGYFHFKLHLVMKFVVSQEEFTHTHSHIHMIDQLPAW